MPLFNSINILNLEAVKKEVFKNDQYYLLA